MVKYKNFIASGHPLSSRSEYNKALVSFGQVSDDRTNKKVKGDDAYACFNRRADGL